ncbi:MAG: doubled protein, partial [Verrucomicrobiales bacterium]|nr:doubled protein [Verrucomicrobiales bacterium]
MTTKKILLIALAAAGLLALPRIGHTQTIKGIEGSVHDFSTNSWNTRKGTCSTCHQAHNTDTAQLVPLWNHKTSTAAFTPYASPTLNATVGSPSGASLACLSCHDGTLAVNEGISGLIGGVSGGTIDPSAQIGPDLHVVHPISFTYDASLAAADGGLEDPTSYKIGDPKTALTYSTAPVPATWSGTSLTGK